MGDIAFTDVLFFIAIFPDKIGGMELFARQLAIELGNRGRSITFCFSTAPSESANPLFDLPNTQLVYLKQQKGFNLSTARNLWGLIRRVRPTTVVYSFGSIVSPLPWICRLAGIKCAIYNDHASRVPGGRSFGTAMRFAARCLTQPINSVIAVSEFVASSSINEKLHNAPTVTILNGVDLVRRKHSATREEFLKSYGIPQQRRIVSQLSWQIKEKGVDTFIAAAAEVLRIDSNVHFIIGGEGVDRTEFERLASSLGVSESVTFTGKIDDPVRSGFYPATDIFCLASRWSEACGLVLLEAMSFGVPIVASRVGGIPELVRDGIDGLLVSGNATAFATAISALLHDGGRRRIMGTSARQRVEESFDVRIMAVSYAEVLTRPLATRERSYFHEGTIAKVS